MRAADDGGGSETLSDYSVRPSPVLGATALAEVAQGTVTFRRPGSARNQLLTGQAALPVGTRFDTSAGRVRLTLAVDHAVGRQSGVFWGGLFTLLQGTASPLTEVVLADGTITNRSAPLGALAATAKRRPSRLWGDAKGSFRTTGRNAVATVRGTRWLTEDDDVGTTVTVVRGVVSVRDEVADKTVTVQGGEKYVARDACESRRSFSVRVRVPAGVRLRSATVRANGRPVPVRTVAGRLTSRVDLRGRPKGVQIVRITLVTTTGVRLEGTRSYRTCAGRLAAGAAPRI